LEKNRGRNADYRFRGQQKIGGRKILPDLPALPVCFDRLKAFFRGIFPEWS
jgi:hypothetical protein